MATDLFVKDLNEKSPCLQEQHPVRRAAVSQSMRKTLSEQPAAQVLKITLQQWREKKRVSSQGGQPGRPERETRGATRPAKAGPEWAAVDRG